MLIKMQRSNAHSDYFIFDKVSHVNYETAVLVKDVGEFLREDKNSDERRSVWYGQEGPVCTFNKISFKSDDGRFDTILFDGEAFICNDDGKTVQRINRIHIPCSPRPIAI